MAGGSNFGISLDKYSICTIIRYVASKQFISLKILITSTEKGHCEVHHTHINMADSTELFS